MPSTAPRITAIDAHDIRFPTFRELDGSDAMNPGPDYSAAYVILRTGDDGPEGHGFTFTLGRGNEVQAAAIVYLASPTAASDTGTALAVDGGMAGPRPRPHKPEG